MLISPAYAQGTGILDQSAMIQFLPLILIFVVFYFLLIRPQQRKAKDHKTMVILGVKTEQDLAYWEGFIEHE